MNLVILDGHTANPGDLDYRGFEALGTVTVYPRTAPDQVRERAQGAEVLLTNKVVLDADLLSELSACRYIGVMATGYNVVDVDAARAAGIAVTNVPAYSTDAVAQLVFAHLLQHCHDIAGHDRAVHDGAWTSSPDFCFWNSPLMELRDKVLGIIGYGGIGRRVAELGRAFGMDVLITSRSPSREARQVDLDALLARSDFISLHCPLTPETQHLINADRLSRMKSGAVLINTARGPLLDGEAVAAALREDRLGAVHLDVLEQEPPAQDDPLLHAPRCVISPHIGWATLEARQRLIVAAISNVAAWMDGRELNRVDLG